MRSVSLTRRATAGIGRTYVRASDPEALERRVAALKDAGLGIGWADGEPGYGPTYLFRDPDGHDFGIYYESEWFTAPEDSKPSLKNQAQARPRPRGRRPPPRPRELPRRRRRNQP